MLIDLRELLSGSQDELTVSACLDMDKFDDGLNCYEIVSKEPFQLIQKALTLESLSIVYLRSQSLN